MQFLEFLVEKYCSLRKRRKKRRITSPETCVTAKMIVVFLCWNYIWNDEETNLSHKKLFQQIGAKRISNLHIFHTMTNIDQRQKWIFTSFGNHEKSARASMLQAHIVKKNKCITRSFSDLWQLVRHCHCHSCSTWTSSFVHRGENCSFLLALMQKAMKHRLVQWVAMSCGGIR